MNVAPLFVAEHRRAGGDLERHTSRCPCDARPQARHPGPNARSRLERAVEVNHAFDVHGEPVDAGIGESLEIAIGFRDHEMRLERKARHPTERSHHDGADREVRHEVPIHDAWKPNLP